MKLKRLYKTLKTGTIQSCDISTVDDKVIISTGLPDGKKRTDNLICSAQGNLSAIAQAKKEAFDIYNLKVKDGYTRTRDKETNER